LHTQQLLAHSIMNIKGIFIVVAAALFLSWDARAQKNAKPVPPGLESRLEKFFSSKEAQARALVKKEGKEPPPEMWDFFKAGQKGDWTKVKSLYSTLRRGAYQYDGGKKDKRLETMAWSPLNECDGAYDGFSGCEEKYVVMFGREILDSIPQGSIYFGGTDPGRFLVTAFCESHPKGHPSYVLTQNALADGLYLKYIRTMYGEKLTLPTDEDSKKAFDSYLKDAKQRLNDGKLKPGENVKDVDGKVQVSGQVAVMDINGRLARNIFDANPDQEFFIEESFPLDWMYPHLSPHGLIMKIERKPHAEMPEDVVRTDREYWTDIAGQAIGQWLTPETSVKEVCDFAIKVFEAKEMGDYGADPKFVRNAYACKTYSKLRSSIGGVYAWRVKHSGSANEKKRMEKEADFAFRQAFAMCPYSPEAVFRYTNLLIEKGRKKDALLLAETAEKLDPRNSSFGSLINQLQEAEEK
jgi:hypothetical protein